MKDSKKTQCEGAVPVVTSELSEVINSKETEQKKDKTKHVLFCPIACVTTREMFAWLHRVLADLIDKFFVILVSCNSTDINECEKKTCKKAECVNTFGGYQCVCKDGFEEGVSKKGKKICKGERLTCFFVSAPRLIPMHPKINGQ